MLQHVRRRVRDPPTDREQRRCSGQHHACGQGEYDGQRVTHAAWVTRVRDLSKPLQQAGHLAGPNVGLLAELVKGRRNRR
jgi:hypothetical protein